MGRSDPNREEAHRCAVRSHSLVQLANHYREQAEIWLKTSDDDLKKVAQDLLEAAFSPFDKVDHAEQALQIVEMSRRPLIAMCSVRGIGVAESVSTSTEARSWASPSASSPPMQ